MQNTIANRFPELPEPRQIQITDEIEQPIPPTNIAVDLSCGAIAVGREITADDYLLFLEKSQPPKKPGSSARAIGQENAIAWLISRAFTVDNQALNDALMDELCLELGDFNSLVSALLSVSGEAICNDDAASIQESKDFIFEGRNIKRKPISWRYGMKLQSKLSEGRIYDAYSELFIKFWLVDGEAITKEMMNKPSSQGGIGGSLAVIIFQCLTDTLS